MEAEGGKLGRSPHRQTHQPRRGFDEHFAFLNRVTLHSYRYAWAERAKTAGYPERFAQEALGHNSKAVHRAYPPATRGPACPPSSTTNASPRTEGRRGGLPGSPGRSRRERPTGPTKRETLTRSPPDRSVGCRHEPRLTRPPPLPRQDSAAWMANSRPPSPP